MIQKNNQRTMKKNRKVFVGAFSLIEMLLTVVLIGILAKIAISNFAGAVPDSSRVIARQQQAVLQEALNCWVSNELSTPGRSINDAFVTYNSYSNAQKITNCLQPYLSPEMLPTPGAAAPTTFTIEANGTLTSRASSQINSNFQILPWALGALPPGAPAGAVARPDSAGPVIQFNTTASPSNP
jgi:prepilin-type N-terminal cleavage/methylation domain-containing protein